MKQRSSIRIFAVLAIYLMAGPAGCACNKPANYTVLVNVERDKAFSIALPANQSTGYSWHFQKERNDNVVRLLSDDYLLHSNRSIAGAPGVKVWHFKAVDKGKATYLLRYKQGWQEDSEDDLTGCFKIEIKEKRGKN